MGVFSGIGFFNPVEVAAAPPVCYRVTRTGPDTNETTLIDCASSPSIAALGELQNDRCYVVNFTGVSDFAITSVTCQNYQAIVEGRLDEFQDEINNPNGVDTGVIQNPDRDHNENCSGGQDCLEDNELVIIAKVVVNLLSALVGIVVTIVIVLAGIQYASSGGNPQAVASARKSIVNGVIALVAFGLLWTGLQWLIPGGLF